MTPTLPPRATRSTNWLVRLEGDPTLRPLDTAQQVLDGVREGDWDPTDEVRGPGEKLWRPIEEHPTFADAIALMGPPPSEPEDETRLDMNPLIDVALVLLIFFILTATVSTLRRTIDVPAPQSEDAGSPVVQKQDIEDRVFNVTVTLNDREEPVVALNDRVILFDRLEQELKDVVNSTGRKEMYLKMSNDVLWETEVQIRSAATDAGVRTIHIPQKR